MRAALSVIAYAAGGAAVALLGLFISEFVFVAPPVDVHLAGHLFWWVAFGPALGRAAWLVFRSPMVMWLCAFAPALAPLAPCLSRPVCGSAQAWLAVWVIGTAASCALVHYAWRQWRAPAGRQVI